MEETLKTILRPVVPKSLRPWVKALHRRWLRLYYAGDRYLCPICGMRSRKLLPAGYPFPVLVEKQVIGGLPGPILCPLCRSLNRTRLLYLFLSNQTDLFQRPRKILHFAPEPMLEVPLRKVSGADYITADLYAPQVMVKVDITNIQFRDNTFDAIICCHVLEHIPDDQKAMTELLRVLKPGGWAVLQVPISLTLEKTYEDFSITSERERELAFGQSDHVRIYAGDYQDRLQQAGFKVSIFRWTSEPEKFGTLQNKFGLNEKEAVYRVFKPGPVNG